VAAVGIWNNTSWLVVDQTGLIGDLDGWTGLDRRGQQSPASSLVGGGDWSILCVQLRDLPLSSCC
jgi:hypothetical protein